ncbi:MAG: hypothetical protein RML35_03095 [Chloroherpetonaceae bacterium]|nr:hypothetical protein [Chloroherpetonaceae bacterium]
MLKLSLKLTALHAATVADIFMLPALENELPPLAAEKGRSVEAFKAEFLVPYKEAYYFASTPCPMLQPDNLCSIYAH